MTWHCPAWASNLIGDFPDHHFEDGDDCDDIYSEARCTSFRRRADAYVDQHDERYETQLDDDNAECAVHDRTATWETEYTTVTDLHNVGFYVCPDDDQTFHTEEALIAHNTDDHEGDDHEGDGAPFVWRAPAGQTYGVRTSHSGWASP